MIASIARNQAFKKAFKERGYFVVRNLLTPRQCSALLKGILETLPGSSEYYVHEKDYRLHSPLVIDAHVRQALAACAEVGGEVMDAFLRRRKFLVELSSITVFPGAVAQHYHRDEMEKDKHIASFFVNLFPTVKGVGAFGVVPGSHVGKWPKRLNPKILELPAGSVVFMDGKLIHAGTENNSLDRVRPVIYGSFGDDDIQGPTYSLRPDYRRKFQLSDFRATPADERTKPKIAAGFWPSADLSDPSPQGSLLLMFESAIWQTVTLKEGEAWLVEFMRLISSEKNDLSVGELSVRLKIGTGKILNILKIFSELGFLVW